MSCQARPQANTPGVSFTGERLALRVPHRVVRAVIARTPRWAVRRVLPRRRPWAWRPWVTRNWWRTSGAGWSWRGSRRRGRPAPQCRPPPARRRPHPSQVTVRTLVESPLTSLTTVSPSDVVSAAVSRSGNEPVAEAVVPPPCGRGHVNLWRACVTYPVVASSGSGNAAASSLRTPDARTDRSATAAVQVSVPEASRTRVTASVSMMLGGVPRVCAPRSPEPSCTAAKGGMRNSTSRPGWRWASRAHTVRLARANSSRRGSGPGSAVASNVAVWRSAARSESVTFLPTRQTLASRHDPHRLAGGPVRPAGFR